MMLIKLNHYAEYLSMLIKFIKPGRKEKKKDSARSLKILSCHDSPINAFSQYILLCLNSLSKGLSKGENIRHGANLKIINIKLSSTFDIGKIILIA